MPNQLIKLQEGLLVEVEVPPDQVQRIAGGLPEQVDESINAVHTLLLNACRPMVSVWNELNKEMSISSAEVELQLGFSAQGSVFLAKASGSANLKVKISISPKAES
ncbi:CU044_2847 family protein [Candidatus Electronema sp. PJ]|uniref:CU044_2847 family protein n=1 Tax=Candidatus Electronema sp. PJ TaxID=3401572 RepID=UPI003AA9AB1A